MKQATTASIRQLEPGDKLTFALTDYTVHGESWEGPRQFDVTVKYTYKSTNFGWQIHTVEKIGPEAEDTFYLDDDWDIRTPDGLVVV